MAQRPKAEYPCKQLELYAVLRIGLGNYREKLADFTAFKAKYDATWGDDFETEINAAAAMPDFQTRDEVTETLGVQLEAKATECANKWQDLKRYIADVEAWSNSQKAKLEAAGSTLYAQAAHGNWDVMMGMLQTANNFITNNLAELTLDDNMPAGFQGEFTALATGFGTIYTSLADGIQDNAELTDEKVSENNTLHAKLMTMFLDGQAIFRHSGAEQERFIFQHVLSIVRGSAGVTKTFDIQPENYVQIKRVVKNSFIVNTGDVPIWVDKGLVETQGPSAIELQPEEQYQNADSSADYTIFNNSTTETAQCTARVMVD